MKVLSSLILRKQRSIGDVKLDGVLSEKHEHNVKLTKYPVEFGANVTDHAIIEPAIITIEGIVSNTPNGIDGYAQTLQNIGTKVKSIFKGGLEVGPTRSEEAYGWLLDLKDKREPIDLQTGLRVYKNMMITSLSTEQDKDTVNTLIFTMTLEEVIFTDSESVFFGLAASFATSGAPSVGAGLQKAKTPDTGGITYKSVAKKLFG